MTRSSVAMRGAGVALALLAAAACGGEPAPEWAGTIVREGETTVVRNPIEPLLPDSAISSERLWAVPEDPLADASAGWARPQDVMFVGDTAFVMDSRNRQVHVVSLDGHWARSFGRTGDGPGELRFPLSVIPFRDSLAVLDVRKGALQLFSTAGVPGGLIRLGSFVPRASALADGSVLVQTRAESWTRLDPDGSTRPFPMPGMTARDVRIAASDSSCRLPTVSSGVVLLYGCTTPALSIVDADITIRRRFEFPGSAPVVLTEAQRDSFRNRSAGSLQRSGMAQGTAQTIATAQAAGLQRNRFWGAALDTLSGISLLWEQESSANGAPGALVHLFSPEGVYVARHRFPEPWRLVAFTGGDLVVSSTDAESGLERLARYRLRLPPGALARAADIARRARPLDQ